MLSDHPSEELKNNSDQMETHQNDAAVTDQEENMNNGNEESVKVVENTQQVSVEETTTLTTIPATAADHAPKKKITTKLLKRLHAKRKKLNFSGYVCGIALFDHPKVMYKWGEMQHEAHTVWGSLFFDLTYVGVAYQLGNIIVTGLKEGNFIGALGLFVAIYFTLEMAWFLKLFFDSRFQGDDFIHRLWQIGLGCMVALAANAINYQQMMNVVTENALTFSCCMLVYVLLDTLPYFEMARYKEQNVKMFAVMSIRDRFTMSLFLAGSVISSALQAPIWVTSLLWFLFAIYFRSILLLRSTMKWLNRDKTVPMHIDFVIHRTGEYAMLMLGESIISIIIVGIKATPNFIATYFLSYFLVSGLSLLIFGALPSHPDQHAARRSAFRSAFYFILVSIQSMALITCGVGFKLLLTSTEASNSKLVPYAWLLSGSLVVIDITVFVGRVLHHGLSEEFFLLQPNSKKIKKILFWFLKLAGTLVLLVAPVMNAPSWGLMLYYVLVTYFLYFLQLLDLRAFEDHHRELIEKEVQIRIEMFKKEYEEKNKQL
jgi:hypothetical protein